MDRRRILAIILLVIAIFIIVSVPIWLLTPVGANVLGLGQPDLNGPPLTPLTFKVMPKPVPQAALTATGKPGDLDASEAILMDDLTGNVLYEKNAETPVPMASTTKIMTALIAMQVGNLNQMITVGQDAVDEDLIGSKAGLVAGSQLSLKDLLYALMLPSGDDAAVAIADGVAGSTQNFVTIMNTEAWRLGLFQTHFFDPTGLDTDLNLNPIPANQHFTTAYDLVRLARYAMAIPLFAQIVSLPSYSLPTSATHGSFLWKNTNTMLTSYQGTLGIKTGWTGAAGGCLVFAAKRNGHTLIGVVLHSVGPNSAQSPDEQTLDEVTRTTDAETLLNWGFKLPMQVPQV